MTAGNSPPLRLPRSGCPSATTATKSPRPSRAVPDNAQGLGAGVRAMCVRRPVCGSHLRPAAAGKPRSHAIRGRRGDCPDHLRKSPGPLPLRGALKGLRLLHARRDAPVGAAHPMLPECSRARPQPGRRHRDGRRDDVAGLAAGRMARGTRRKVDNSRVQSKIRTDGQVRANQLASGVPEMPGAANPTPLFLRCAPRAASPWVRCVGPP